MFDNDEDDDRYESDKGKEIQVLEKADKKKKDKK